MTSYLIAGLAAVAIAGVSAAGFQSVRVTEMSAKLSNARLELTSCGGRLQNILDDVRSDNEIDQLSDDDLRNVPDHWLLPVDGSDTDS